MTARRLLSALLLPALALTACSGESDTTLEIIAAPRTVVITPSAYSDLTVTGTVNGNPLLEGDQITLETSIGSFIGDGDQRVTTLTVAGGRVTARLFAPRNPGTAYLSATYVDPYSKRVEATEEVRFNNPGTIADLNFSCAARNIGAFLSSEELRVKCTAIAKDANGNDVDSAQIRFLAEAGGFVKGDSMDGHGVYFYNPRIGGNQPKDVPPLGDAGTGEPRWQDGPVIRNPRDGLVTLVAWVEGDSFGLGEPFVDENDNGVYDPGEPFADINDNGVWDDAQDSVIWKEIRILWTGQLFAHASASKVEPFDRPLPRLGTGFFTFTMLDRNLNILAANGLDDNINFQTVGPAVVQGASSQSLSNSFGIDIDNQYRLRNANRRESYLRDSTYTISIRNTRSVEDDGDQQPYEVYGWITRQYSVDESGVTGPVIGSEQTPFAQGYCY